MDMGSARGPVWIVGSGRVGSFWARALAALEEEQTLWSRDPVRAAPDLRRVTRQIPASGLPSRPTPWLIILAVPDESLTPHTLSLLQGDLAKLKVKPLLVQDKPLLAHCSGTLTAAVLSAAGWPPDHCVVLHPVHPFAARDPSPPPESVHVAVESSEAARPGLMAWLRAIGVPAFRLSEQHRALYHLACVLVANHAVTLASVAHELLALSTDEPAEAQRALGALFAASVDNLRRAPSLGQALSGPAFRGDRAALERHLEELSAVRPDRVALYRELIRSTLPILSDAAAARILPVLEEPP